MRVPNFLRILGILTMALALLTPGRAGRADDSVLFSTSVAPNVLIVADNSGSMAHTVWHPAFDPGVSPTPAWWCTTPAGTHYVTSDTNYTYCGKTRTLYHDGDLPSGRSTRWDPVYLQWYFGLDSANPTHAQYLNEIAGSASGGIGTRSQCVIIKNTLPASQQTYLKYRRSRATALQDVLRDVICQVNAAGKVRFGIAQFREEGDPEGGHVIVPVDDYSTAQDTALENAIANLSPETWTPLAETLFQVYTYFMSRTSSERPFGITPGTGPPPTTSGTRFPLYNYSTSDAGEGGAVTASPPPSPVQYHCQKSFVIIVTDGEPTRDDFDTDSSGPGGGPRVDAGFGSFKTSLIGDYATGDYAPGSSEAGEKGGSCSECAFYLDDVAKFMQDKDFNPVLQGVQNIDVYTVGFTTNAAANALLSSAATLGNGQFYTSNNAEQLATQLIAAITDIIQKSQAFTAATVPATRTADQGNFYSSFFIPSGTDPFWEGHIKAFTLNAAGEIVDANNNCALNDPVPSQCEEGPILPSAVPHWDAADEMPDPNARTLYTSVAGARFNWDQSFATNAVQLGVTYPPVVSYPGSAATNAEELADEIVQYVRGCSFGTGVTNTCLERLRIDGNPRTLADVFHSDPIVVGAPNTSIAELSYAQFATTFATRTRHLMAGSNGGFLHAFNSGNYVGGGVYDRGTGVERFGFMPWYARTTIKELPIDIGNRSYYYVDGSPSVADVWMYPTATSSNLSLPPTKTQSEWKTALVGSMRQGGPAYFALDVTDPSLGSSYPGYLWEFPLEGETRGFDSSGTYTYLDYMGDSWSKAIITRVKVNVQGDVTGGVYERWVAIFGAGYDPSSDPNTTSYDATADAATSRKGRGVFMVDIKTGAVLAAHFYHHNDADPTLGNAAGGHSAMQYGFASTPAVIDSDFDGFADIVYIGDLGGNLWKWVIRDPALDSINPMLPGPSDRTVNKSQSAWPFGKMFTAPSATISGTDYYKSFFFPPAVTIYGGDLWLAVGTGERANPSFGGADPLDDSENNRFYSFEDPDQFGLPDMNTYRGGSGPLEILESDLTDITNVSGAASFSTMGYYLVSPEGEKFVTEVDIIGFYVFAGAFTPNGSGDPCDSGGTATLYIFKVNSGEGFFPGNTNAADKRRLSLGNGVPTTSRLSLGDDADIYVMTSENEVKKPPAPPLPNAGQGIFYWRELQ